MSCLQNTKILIVDDEDVLLEIIHEELSSLGAAVKTAEDGETALEILGAESFDIIVTDQSMPGINGSELLEQYHNLKGKTSAAVYVLLTGYDPDSIIFEDETVRPLVRFVSKPLRMPDFISTLTELKKVA